MEKSRVWCRIAAKIPSIAIAQAFRKKKEITATNTAANVALRNTNAAEGRRSRNNADGMRISFISIDDMRDIVLIRS